MLWDWIASLSQAIVGTVFDVMPIAVVLLFFQLVVLRQHIPRLRRVLTGFVYVVVGLALFLVGLEKALIHSEYFTISVEINSISIDRCKEAESELPNNMPNLSYTSSKA